MAVSRFRQNLGPVRSNYIPENFTPNFGAYAEILAKQQGAFDEAEALGEKVPKHLQQDYEAVQGYLGNITSSIDELAKTYADEGVMAGNRKRKELLRTVNKDWQPGGKADRFQQRLNTYQLERKRIEEQYKDDPRIAQYYINQIKVNPFEDETAPNYGIGTPTLDKVLSTEELGNYYDKVIGNIQADQVVQWPFLDKATLAGVSFKDLLVTGKTKYIDWNKAARVLAGATTAEIQRSEEVKGRAYGVGEGQSQFLKFKDDGTLELDKEGRLQFADTTLGRLLKGYASGVLHYQQDLDSKIVNRSFDEARALKELDEKDAFGNIMLTQPYNVGKSMFNNKGGYFEVKGNEIIVKGSKKNKEQQFRSMLDDVTDKVQKGLPYHAGGIYIIGSLQSFVRQLFGKNDRISLDDPRIANTVDNLTAQGVLKSDMSDEAKTTALANELNRYIINATESAQITPIIGDTPNAKRYREGLQTAMFGDLKEGTPGFISNLKVWDQKGELRSGTEIFKKAKESETPPILEAEVMAPESLLPFGTRTFQIGDQEYQTEPLLSDKIKPQYILNMAYRASNDVLNNFSVEDELPTLNDQVRAQLPKKSQEKIPTGTAVYKMEATPNGHNLYLKTGAGKYEKLNDDPINFTANARQ